WTTDVEQWLAGTFAQQEAGSFVPFAVLHEGTVVGSTSYLSLAPEHLRLEIGNTWLHPSTWGTGANVEAKYLLLRHAFETLGCLRVEFKTDARNERARAALAALPAAFEGIHRKHMVVRGDRRRMAGREGRARAPARPLTRAAFSRRLSGYPRTGQCGRGCRCGSS